MCQITDPKAGPQSGPKSRLTPCCAAAQTKNQRSASRARCLTSVPTWHALPVEAECPRFRRQVCYASKKQHGYFWCEDTKHVSALMGVVKPLEPRAALCHSFLPERRIVPLPETLVSGRALSTARDLHYLLRVSFDFVVQTKSRLVSHAASTS